MLIDIMCESLINLCIDELIKKSLPSIIIMDIIPYELYEKYKSKLFKKEIECIPSIVKCVLFIELYDRCMWNTSKNLRISQCQRIKHGHDFDLYQDTYSNLDIVFKKEFPKKGDEEVSGRDRGDFYNDNYNKYSHIMKMLGVRVQYYDQ
jgi:hypothetical protein